MRFYLFFLIVLYSSSVFAVEVMDSGTPSKTKVNEIYFKKDGTCQSSAGAESGTNTSITSLAAHESGTITMNGNIKLNEKWLSGDGGNEGIVVAANGEVGVGTSTTSSQNSFYGISNSLYTRGGTFLLDDSQQFLVDARTNPRGVTIGIARINMKAAIDGVRPLLVDVDAAGYGDIKGVAVQYTANNIVAGKTANVFEALVDSSNATGGNVYGLALMKTGTGGASGSIGNQASSGTQSVFGSVTAAGGTQANNIGSGGDGGDSGNDINTVVTNYNGLTDTDWGAAGGAGAGGVGGTVTDAAGGTGGAGYSSSITGSATAYGTGGDGSGTGTGVPGTIAANRGLGGHGHGTTPRAGGSGVVIIRFNTPQRRLTIGDNFSITTTGKVGIGTSTPATALQVIGTVTATGYIGNGSGLTGITATTNANLTGHVTSTGNAAVLGSFSSANLAGAISDETGTNTVVFSSGSTQVNSTFTGNTNMPSGVWGSSGNVGIGTNTPATKLHVVGTVTVNNNFQISNAGKVSIGGTVANNSLTVINDGVNGVGIDLRSDDTDLTNVNNFSAARLFADFSSGSYVDSRLYLQTATGDNTWKTGLTIKDGNIGIGTTTPSTQLHTTGGVRLATLGSGAVQSDVDGNLSVSSDERLKIIQGMFTSSLEAILGIEPILYKYNELSGLDQDNVYAGFSAQNVMQYIPEAVGIDSRGYYSFNDRPVIAALVNAVKELKKEIEELQRMNNIILKSYNVPPIIDKTRTIKH